MKRSIIIILIICAAQILFASGPIRPAHTFSIVAYDSSTGEMGVAVQSHWFSVGTDVIWAEAGVGVVATQSFIDPSYGPLGLDLMRGGKTASQALRALLTVDDQREVRQVAMIDVHGTVAVHTGTNCIREAGHIKGDHFSVEANLMRNNTVWPAMATAYKATKGDLLGRLMAALEAAQGQGGDIRGKQSAAILIVPIKSKGQPWKERLVNLRVDDSDHPIKELKRLVMVHRAYTHMNKGDGYMTVNDVPNALREYSAAHKIYPQNMEILYWTAATMAAVGQVDESLPLFKQVFDKEPQWIEVTRRLPAAGLLPQDKTLLDKILRMAK